MPEKREVRNIDEAKDRLEKVIRKEKLNHIPISSNENSKPKKHNK